jgi:hypothetical protein
MNKSTRILIVALLALVADAAVSQAQVRDAGSKLLGNYDHFDRPAQSRFAPTYSRPQATVARDNVAAAPDAAVRSFSYDATKPAPSPSATKAAPAPQAARQATPPQAARRFSYDPGYSAPRRSYAPSRGWQSGVRDAGSKVRGEY